MALAEVVPGRLTRIWLGTAPKTGTPNDPAAILICAFITKSFNQSKATNTQVVPDCDDPFAVGPVKRTVVSLDRQVTGTALFEHAHRDEVQAFYDLDDSAPIVFQIPKGEDLDDGGFYSGNFFMTTLTHNANTGEMVQWDITWDVDGDVSWTGWSNP